MVDPREEYKKKLKLVALIAFVGIGQLVFVIIGRSWLIWEERSSSGSDIVSITPSLLIPNNYIIVATGKFPQLRMEDCVGNVSLTNINTGKNYLFEYRINGYWIRDGEKSAVAYISLKPGDYNITWANNNDRIRYVIVTHGVFNWWAENDNYPYFSETIVLFISIILFVFFMAYTYMNYSQAKRDLAYHQ